MQVSNVQSETQRRTWVRKVSRWGVPLGILALMPVLMGLGGCPCGDDADCVDGAFCVETVCVDCRDNADCSADLPVCVDTFCEECETAADCADDNACTSDTCDENNECPRDALTCDDGDLCTDDDCDPATGCVFEERPCDDGDNCTDDVCDPGTGECVSTDVECPEGQTCLDGDCTETCVLADDCDDEDACTDDACVAGACSHTDQDCDDGVACTDDSCDAGECANVDNCPGDETCNTTTGLCDTTPPCDEDNPCVDDGLFCNGVDECDADLAACVAGADPCAATDCAGQTPICSEGDTAAVCTCPVPDTLDFTLGQDNLIGTTGDDVFNGPIEFSPGAGMQIETLQTGDKATGLAGNDTLNATSNGGAATPTLDGIEHINISVFDGGFTLAANKITGAQTVNSVDSTQLLTVTNLPNIVGLGLMNTDAGITVSFDSTATSGLTDNLAVTLDPVNGGTITVTPGAANGFESASIASTGTGKNMLANLTQTAGTSLVTISFTGAQPMELRRTDATVVTFDGGSMTADLTLGTGDGSNATPYLAFHATNVNIKSITGGTGDDLFVFGTTFNGNDASGTTEFIDGGAGTGDGMQATLSSSIGSVMPIKDIENLFLNATATSSVNLTGVTGLTKVWIDGASGGPSTDVLTLLNISGTPLPALDFRGDGTQAAQNYDAVEYKSTGTGGSGDSLTVTVGNRGTALNASGTTNGHTLGTLEVPFVENLTFTASDGPATVTTGIDASTLVSLTVNGSSNVTLNLLKTTTGTDITSINAGGVTGNFSVTCADLATGASLTSGGGNDLFTIGDSSATSSVVTMGAGNDTYTSTDTDSADVINAGAGTDTIESHGGSDTISTGSEADTVIFTTTATVDKNTVSDFTAGAGGDVARFDISSLGLAAGDELRDIIGNVAVGATEEIVILITVGYATQGAADTAINARITAAALDQVYFYFDTGSNTTKIIHFVDSNTGASTLIGELTNITTQAGHDALIVANIDSRA